MTVKAITKYQADDGQTFDSMTEALSHNARHKAVTMVRTAMQIANPNGTIATWDRDIVMNVKGLETLRDACNSALTYHRNHGKLKKTA